MFVPTIFFVEIFNVSIFVEKEMELQKVPWFFNYFFTKTSKVIDTLLHHTTTSKGHWVFSIDVHRSPQYTTLVRACYIPKGDLCLSLPYVAVILYLCVIFIYKYLNEMTKTLSD